MYPVYVLILDRQDDHSLMRKQLYAQLAGAKRAWGNRVKFFDCAMQSGQQDNDRLYEAIEQADITVCLLDELFLTTPVCEEWVERVIERKETMGDLVKIYPLPDAECNWFPTPLSYYIDYENEEAVTRIEEHVERLLAL
jgi:hypothetical protein